MPDPTETSLHVRRALAGDEGSLDWIIRHFSPLLLAQARYRLGRHLKGLYDPEDLVQHVWGVCLPKLGQIVAREGRFTPVLLRFLGTTLLRTYHHLVEKHLAGKPRKLETATEAEGGGLGVRLTELPASVSGVVTRVVLQESREQVEAGLAVLSAPQREIFILRAMEEMPYKVAATKLGATEEALRARYHRALEELRRSLPPSMVDELQEAI